jgi:hypothetical protein
VNPRRLRFLARAAFWSWALALFVGTHWPALTLPGTGRPDLFVHASIFGVWTALLIACGYFGPALSRRNLVLVLPVAVLYAALDEWLQGIPWVRRHAALDDWACNVLGIVAVSLGALALGLRTPRPVGSGRPPVDTLGPRA